MVPFADLITWNTKPQPRSKHFKTDMMESYWCPPNRAKLEWNILCIMSFFYTYIFYTFFLIQENWRVIYYLVQNKVTFMSLTWQSNENLYIV